MLIIQEQYSVIFMEYINDIPEYKFIGSQSYHIYHLHYKTEEIIN